MKLFKKKNTASELPEFPFIVGHAPRESDFNGSLLSLVGEIIFKSKCIIPEQRQELYLEARQNIKKLQSGNNMIFDVPEYAYTFEKFVDEATKS